MLVFTFLFFKMIMMHEMTIINTIVALHKPKEILETSYYAIVSIILHLFLLVKSCLFFELLSRFLDKVVEDSQEDLKHSTQIKSPFNVFMINDKLVEHIDDLMVLLIKPFTLLFIMLQE
jgi:hypothetical protein